MGTIVIAGIVVLVILGFGNHAWWLAAAVLLFLYAQYGRGSSASSPGGPPGAAASYQEYRERRDLHAKWERRYRRERPFEHRRQERDKSK
ncbi:hypothetical protein ABZ468_00135 [Streptomyces sp. NPDC005708]|jgi:hypothetical protein|uniref:hypothetical protein n=1 Tax=unclassified Streptomyces TaxID=2593676 RepID=UPI0033E1922E